MLRNLTLISRLLGLLSACAGQQAAEQAAEQAEAMEQQRLQQEQLAEQRLLQRRQVAVTGMLARAQRALSRDQLMTPAADNAFGWYQQVLALQPRSEEAHWGMRQITDRYLELAVEAFKAGDNARAEVLLDRAQQIAASPADVASLRQQYRREQPEYNPENEFLLSAADLAARNEVAAEELQLLAIRAMAADSRLLIIARNDREGRWIYQQMRTAVEGYRLRGNIKLGRKPRVVLIDVEA